MLKQGLHQKLLQKLSPQQIQFIKLLQVPTAELEARIEQELEDNPALVEAAEMQQDELSQSEDSSEEYDNEVDEFDSPEDSEKFDEAADLDLWGEDDYDYRMRQQKDPNREQYEAPVVSEDSQLDNLIEQVQMQNLSERELLICQNIIGNIDPDGYLRRDIYAIVDDLAFKYNLNTTPEEVEEALSRIQQLDPAGIGARDLQECLLLQLDRKPQTAETELALRILMDCFEEFTKKHFDRIINKCETDEETFKTAYNLITKLNPKPGGGSSGAAAQYIIPDFILTVDNGEINIKLNSRNQPELRINNSYKRMLREAEAAVKNSRAAKETMQFVRSKIESARWFIDAIQQRQFTLLNTMMSIAEKQKAFFLSDGDETKLVPMILKDVADEIEMDISTVSRVANNKYVQTPFGIFQLKSFFSEGIATSSGEEVSNREVKSILKRYVDAEDKRKPLSDQKLAEMLKDEGYEIARRTVAKYREQLDIPVARLRKEI